MSGVEKQVHYVPSAGPVLPVFCHATTDPRTGLIFCSGTIGCTTDFHVPDGIEAQTELALQNMSKVLEAAGSSLEHVLKANIYMTNQKRDFSAMNEVYIKFFKQVPARTCVGVATLPFDALMEIECTALPK